MRSAAHTIADQCLLMRARRLSRATTRIYLDHMAQHGLTVAQFTLLAAIGANPGARAADLGPSLDLEKSTLSRELAALLRDGLIAGEQMDGRSLSLTLTPGGQARLDEAFPSWERAQAQVSATLGPLADALLRHFSSP